MSDERKKPPEAQGDIFKLLDVSKQKSRNHKCSFYNDTKQRNEANPEI